MLRSFEIERFRTFSHLQIKQLGCVNLVVGRNNVGKSMLLEALRLYGSGGHPAVLANVLYERNEVFSGRRTKPRWPPLVRLTALFHGRNPEVGEGGAIHLRAGNCGAGTVTTPKGARCIADEPREGDSVKDPTDDVHEGGLSTVPGDPFALRLQVDSDATGGPRGRLQLREDLWPEMPGTGDQETDLVLSVFQGGQPAYVADVVALARYGLSTRRLGHALAQRPALVPPRGVASRVLARQWDQLVLHDAEERVKECLALIAPVHKISAVEHPQFKGNRMFVIRLPGSDPIPLKAAGDGMVRTFQIAVALELAAYGQDPRERASHERTLFPLLPEWRPPSAARMLLIDELENGIHHTVLPELWRFMLGVAKLRDVQVFATTHSWDCVEAFQAAASQDPEADAMLIRLEKKRDIHRAVTFSQQELAIVTRDRIEVR